MARRETTDLKLEAVVIPVSEVEASVSDLSKALQRAAVADGEHEARIGVEDPASPDCYAEYMVREQTGEELPS